MQPWCTIHHKANQKERILPRARCQRVKPRWAAQRLVSVNALLDLVGCTVQMYKTKPASKALCRCLMTPYRQCQLSKCKGNACPSESTCNLTESRRTCRTFGPQDVAPTWSFQRLVSKANSFPKRQGQD